MKRTRQISIPKDMAISEYHLACAEHNSVSPLNNKKMRHIKLFLLIFILLTYNLSQSQIITIPDANFKNALLNHDPIIDINSDGEIQVSEAEATLELNLNSKNISSLDGIAAFVNLTVLDCNLNNLTSLDLSSNIALTELYCSSNNLSNLSFSENAALGKLMCYNNSLSNLDISSNTNLYYLWCSNSNLNNLDLSTNTALTHLFCYNNNLTNLNLSNNILLEYLDFNNNTISNIDISLNTALKNLSCSANNLMSIDVSNATNLKYFSCFDNNLTNLSLENNPSLIYLRCAKNNLTDLDISYNTLLTKLRCEDNVQLLTLNLKNGNNSNFDISSSYPSNFENLPELTSVCVDDVASDLVSFINNQVGHSITFTEDCTSLSTDNNYLADFSVFPNPTSNLVTIEAKTQIITIIVYNQLGQVMLSKSNQNSIDFFKLNKGIYFMKIENSNGDFAIQKVIKE